MYQEVNLTGNRLASKKLTGIIGIAGGGTTDYNLLNNKPSINGITLSGNKTGSDLGLVDIAKVSSAIVHGRAKGASPSFYTDIDDLPISRFITDIVAAQSGSGTPSPSNVRAISGYTDVVIKNDVQGATQATYTINLGSTVYGGELDVTTGILTIKYNIIPDLGNVVWTLNDANHIFRTPVSDIKNPTNNAERREGIICSCYKPSESVLINASMDNEGMLKLLNQLYIRDNAYSDATTFKSSLSGQQFAYERATPVVIQLTPTEVKTLLGDNNIYANSGDVDILYYVTLGGMINE